MNAAIYWLGQNKAAPNAWARCWNNIAKVADGSNDTRPLAALSTERIGNRREFYRSAARLGVQVTDALQYAHMLGVVHRDIKPSNLLVDLDGHPWITDFGFPYGESTTSTERSKQRGIVEQTRHSIKHIYLSPKSAIIVSCSMQSGTYVWSIEDQNLVKKHRLKSRSAFVTAAAFSKDGRWLATVGENTELWNTADWSRRAVLANTNCRAVRSARTIDI